MADKQEAPQLTDGSIVSATNALLGMMEPEEAKPESEEAQPEEVEESTEEIQDESSEEVSEDVSEEEEESPEEESEEELDEYEDEEESNLNTTYAVKVDGEEVEVDLDELIQGYSRQSDYTRKTQELASKRGEMEQLQQQWSSEISQAQAERQQYIDALGQFVQNSMGGLEQFQNVDWENLRQTDPIAFVTKKEELREAQDRVRQAQEEQGKALQKQQEETAKLRQLAVQEEHTKLVAAVPEWNDAEKRGKMAGELSAYAVEQGFTKEELQQLIDHRSLIVLMKAQKYDALRKSDVKAKKIKNKPKVVRSGKGVTKKASDRSKRTAQMKRLQQTGHVDDAASLLEDMFNS
jgi:hypothetical protein